MAMIDRASVAPLMREQVSSALKKKVAPVTNGPKVVKKTGSRLSKPKTIKAR